MQNLLQDLVKLLEQDDRLVIDGQLFKNKVIELALALDSSLIRLLLSSDGIRRHFFQDADGILVFDKIKFQQFVSNKAFLPDSYTAFKNKIGLTAEGSYLTDSKEVVLAWPYKDCVLEGGQTNEDAKRDEIFWNETLAPDQIDRLLAPKVLTNFKKNDKDGEHKVTSITSEDNLIIKGNNLLALHTLKKVYTGKVNLIYIDPPYNTGNDSFQYNDTFNHSTWLTFMKNRLEVSKELLKSDGAIFISCDDNEQAYLKILADEVFGEENFYSQIIIQSNKRGQTYNQISKTHEYLLVYSKSSLFEANELVKDGDFEAFDDIGGYELRELRNRNPKFGRFNRPNLFYSIYVNPTSADEDGCYSIQLEKKGDYTQEIFPLNSSGGESCWRWGSSKATENIDGNTRLSTLVAKKKTSGEYGIYEKYRKKTYKVKSIWIEKEVISEQGTKELGKLGLADQFDFPKPTYLIKKIIQIGSDSSSIILDFCAGSGTTAHAVLDLNKEDGGNRKFILCEQMHYIDTTILQRVQKVIENNKTGSFLYCELAQANQLFVDRILAAKGGKELQGIWKEMQEKAFLSYKVDPKKIDLAGVDFVAMGLEDQQRFLIEVMDKNMLYVPASEIDDITYGISEEDKKLNRQFFGES